MRISTSLYFGKFTFLSKILTFLTLLFISSAAISQQTLDVQLVSKDYGGGYQITCYGGSNGAIKSQVVGGEPPYTYNWSNGSHSPNINNLTAGNYILTVIDASGNTSNTSIELYQPKPIGAIVNKSEYGDYNISKNGVSDGWAELRLYGGVNPNTVYWNNGQQGWKIEAVSAGTFTYTITDELNCTSNGSLTLTQPTPLSASVQILQLPAACAGLYGIAKANVTGGDPPYFYSWENGSRDETVTNLNIGEQKVYINDESGAQIDVAFTISLAAEPMAISLTPTVYPNGRNTSCYTCTNGIIQTSITGGLAPFTYNWQPIGATTSNINNLAGGHYTLLVTDHSGCVASSDVYLTSAERDDWGMNGSVIDATTHFIGSTNNADVIFKRNNLESLRLGNNGKVGIGVSDPQFGLDVNGTARINGTLKLDLVPEITTPQEITETKILVRGQANDVSSVGIEDILANMSRCKLSPNGSTLINWVPTPSFGGMPARLTAGTVDCKPYVGIGTESPVTHLQVEGSTFTQKLKIGGGNYAFNHDFEVTGNSFLTGNFTSNLSENQSFTINQTETQGYNFLIALNANNNNTKAIGLQNNNTNTFNLYADGRMELGNPNEPINTTASKLKVYGLISARRIVVTQTNFADYVFEKDYKLLSFEELKKHIENNKSLPGLPTQKEIETQGFIDLQEIQVKNIAKTEELFLYVLKLKEEIELLKIQLNKITNK